MKYCFCLLLMLLCVSAFAITPQEVLKTTAE